MNEPAAVFHPEGEVNEAHIARALDHCKEHHYDLYGIVRTWQAAHDLIARREVLVIVVARQDHIDPAWAPRIECAGDDNRAGRQAAAQRPRQRRARLVRRY